MSKPIIAVTGRNGQLGYELEQFVSVFSDRFTFVLVDRDLLDIGKASSIADFFQKYHPVYFINCAAYTAVDKAETAQEAAYLINAEAVGIIAQQCHKYGCTLIHISTDYVFNGNGTEPYQTNEPTDPVNYYGYTKWIGEKLALENNQRTIIVRTSWLYSSHGNNFVKTMLRLMKERPEIKVVSDQTGSPTYAADLANMLLHVIMELEKGNLHYGIYHYSNEGMISWYEFAKTIQELENLPCKILPILTSDYPTPAKRPAYSVLDASSLVNDFGIQMINWKESLIHCLALLKS